jgi:hypothetical protein
VPTLWSIPPQQTLVVYLLISSVTVVPWREKDGRDGGKEEYMRRCREVDPWSLTSQLTFSSRESSSPSCDGFGKEEKGKVRGVANLERKTTARRNKNETTTLRLRTDIPMNRPNRQSSASTGRKQASHERAYSTGAQIKWETLKSSRGIQRAHPPTP